MNPNLKHLIDNVPKYRICALQGGTRSGKSYSVLEYIIGQSIMRSGAIYTIARGTYKALRASAERDFFEILQTFEGYNPKLHNKSDHTYRLNGNLIEFIGLDQAQKVQGRKRNFLFVNEAIEVDYDAWVQLLLRTTHKAVIDFNPSEYEHWIYDHVLTRPDCATIVTTYKDNPHLGPEQIAEIERLKTADPDLWRIYGDGQRGQHRNLIYSHWTNGHYQEPVKKVYGLDFGFTHATALIEIGLLSDGRVQWDEKIYQTKINTSELIQLMKEYGIDNRTLIYADSARPDAIEEIRRSGYRIMNADKSVIAGINKVKSNPLVITNNSINLKREIKQYKWMDNKQDQPVKFMDDALDAARYGTMGLIGKPQAGGAKFIPIGEYNGYNV
jgi:phage terminase large subunit